MCQPGSSLADRPGPERQPKRPLETETSDIKEKVMNDVEMSLMEYALSFSLPSQVVVLMLSLKPTLSCEVVYNLVLTSGWRAQALMMAYRLFFSC